MDILLHSYARKSFIKLLGYDLNLEEIEVLNEQIPHYRYFEFFNDDYRIIIRPDAGVEHGWRLVKANIDIEDLNSLDHSFEILKMNSHPILYTISIDTIRS